MLAQDGSELQFRIRHNTPLQKVRPHTNQLIVDCDLHTHESFSELVLHLQVCNAYAQKRSLQLSDCKFVCDGNILNGTQTAEEVGSKMLARSPLLPELSMTSSVHPAGSIGRWGCHRHDGLTDRRMITTRRILQPSQLYSTVRLPISWSCSSVFIQRTPCSSYTILC